MLICTWFLKSLVYELDCWTWICVYFELDFCSKNQVQINKGNMPYPITKNCIFAYNKVNVHCTWCILSFLLFVTFLKMNLTICMYPVHTSIPKETFGLRLDLKPIQNLIYAQAFLTKHTRWATEWSKYQKMFSGHELRFKYVPIWCWDFNFINKSKIQLW